MVSKSAKHKAWGLLNKFRTAWLRFRHLQAPSLWATTRWLSKRKNDLCPSGLFQLENIQSWTFLGTVPAKTETLNAALFTGLRFEFRAQIILMLLAYQI